MNFLPGFFFVLQLTKIGLGLLACRVPDSQVVAHTVLQRPVYYVILHRFDPNLLLLLRGS